MFNVEKQLFHWRQRKINGKEVNMCTRLLVGGLLIFTASAMAAPDLNSLNEGSATFSGLGTNLTTIDQQSKYIRVTWNSFDTIQGESVIFQQTASSVAVNNILGGRTSFDGTLTGAGTIFLTNQNGITFGKNSVVNVGSLFATTSAVTGDWTADAEGFAFTLNGAGTADDASVVNLGDITISDGGFAILAAPHVENGGTIRANLGTVRLASAVAATGFVSTNELDLRGDRLIGFSLSDQDLADWTGDAGITQTEKGEIHAREITIDSRKLNDVIEGVINLDGLIDATALVDGTLVDGNIANGELDGELSDFANSSKVTIDSRYADVNINGATITSKSRGSGNARVEIVTTVKGFDIKLTEANISSKTEAGTSADAVVKLESSGDILSVTGEGILGSKIVADASEGSTGTVKAQVIIEARGDVNLSADLTAKATSKDKAESSVNVESDTDKKDGGSLDYKGNTQVVSNSENLTKDSESYASASFVANNSDVSVNADSATGKSANYINVTATAEGEEGAIANASLVIGNESGLLSEALEIGNEADFPNAISALTSSSGDVTFSGNAVVDADAESSSSHAQSRAAFVMNGNTVDATSVDVSVTATSIADGDATALAGSLVNANSEEGRVDGEGFAASLAFQGDLTVAADTNSDGGEGLAVALGMFTSPGDVEIATASRTVRVTADSQAGVSNSAQANLYVGGDLQSYIAYFANDGLDTLSPFVLDFEAYEDLESDSDPLLNALTNQSKGDVSIDGRVVVQATAGETEAEGSARVNSTDSEAIAALVVSGNNITAKNADVVVGASAGGNSSARAQADAIFMGFELTESAIPDSDPISEGSIDFSGDLEVSADANTYGSSGGLGAKSDADAIFATAANATLAVGTATIKANSNQNDFAQGDGTSTADLTVDAGGQITATGDFDIAATASGYSKGDGFIDADANANANLHSAYEAEGTGVLVNGDISVTALADVEGFGRTMANADLVIDADGSVDITTANETIAVKAEATGGSSNNNAYADIDIDAEAGLKLAGHFTVDALAEGSATRLENVLVTPGSPMVAEIPDMMIPTGTGGFTLVPGTPGTPAVDPVYELREVPVQVASTAEAEFHADAGDSIVATDVDIDVEAIARGTAFADAEALVNVHAEGTDPKLKGVGIDFTGDASATALAELPADTEGGREGGNLDALGLVNIESRDSGASASIDGDIAAIATANGGSGGSGNGSSAGIVADAKVAINSKGDLDLEGTYLADTDAIADAKAGYSNVASDARLDFYTKDGGNITAVGDYEANANGSGSDAEVAADVDFTTTGGDITFEGNILSKAAASAVGPDSSSTKVDANSEVDFDASGGDISITARKAIQSIATANGRGSIADAIAEAGIEFESASLAASGTGGADPIFTFGDLYIKGRLVADADAQGSKGSKGQTVNAEAYISSLEADAKEKEQEGLVNSIVIEEADFVVKANANGGDYASASGYLDLEAQGQNKEGYGINFEGDVDVTATANASEAEGFSKGSANAYADAWFTALDGDIKILTAESTIAVKAEAYDANTNNLYAEADIYTYANGDIELEGHFDVDAIVTTDVRSNGSGGASGSSNAAGSASAVFSAEGTGNINATGLYEANAYAQTVESADAYSSVYFDSQKGDITFNGDITSSADAFVATSSSGSKGSKGSGSILVKKGLIGSANAHADIEFYTGGGDISITTADETIVATATANGAFDAEGQAHIIVKSYGFGSSTGASGSSYVYTPPGDVSIDGHLVADAQSTALQNSDSDAYIDIFGNSVDVQNGDFDVNSESMVTAGFSRGSANADGYITIDAEGSNDAGVGIGFEGDVDVVAQATGSRSSKSNADVSLLAYGKDSNLDFEGNINAKAEAFLVDISGQRFAADFEAQGSALASVNMGAKGGDVNVVTEGINSVAKGESILYEGEGGIPSQFAIADAGVDSLESGVSSYVTIAGENITLDGPVVASAVRKAGDNDVYARTALYANGNGAEQGVMTFVGDVPPQAIASGPEVADVQGYSTRYQECVAGDPACGAVTAGEKVDDQLILAQLIIDADVVNVPLTTDDINNPNRVDFTPLEVGTPGGGTNGFTSGGDFVAGLGFDLETPAGTPGATGDFDPNALPATAAGGTSSDKTFCGQFVNGSCNEDGKGEDKP